MGKDIVKKPRGHNLRGRPPGQKNKSTIFKEVMQLGFEKALEKKFPELVKLVLERALKGDMKAAKMLFDRVVPVSKAIDLDNLSKKGISISIHVGEMDTKNPHGIIDGDYKVVEENENGNT